MEWLASGVVRPGEFPEYFKREGEGWVPVPAHAVPPETGLATQRFPTAKAGNDYVTPTSRAWTTPGPASKPSTARLRDGSEVTYVWYRFIDQPVFQQYRWEAGRKERLQKLVEGMHAHWTIDREYMAPPTSGSLVRLDPALIVAPPKGMERGYVPIVVGQRAGPKKR
jgi:hypothetical protein